MHPTMTHSSKGMLAHQLRKKANNYTHTADQQELQVAASIVESTIDLCCLCPCADCWKSRREEQKLATHGEYSK